MMNDELAALAKRKGVEPPTGPDLASQAKGAVVGVMPGKAFDKHSVHRDASGLLRSQPSEVSTTTCQPATEVRIVRQLTGMAPVLVRDAAGQPAWFLPTAALLAPLVTNIEELVEALSSLV